VVEQELAVYTELLAFFTWIYLPRLQLQLTIF
jgi:hypothetical protein